MVVKAFSRYRERVIALELRLSSLYMRGKCLCLNPGKSDNNFFSNVAPNVSSSHL